MATTAIIEPESPLETESVNDFEVRVASESLVAHDEGRVASLEAAPHIFKIINRKGMNGGEYFWYKGVKVCPLGKTEEIEEAESVPTQERLHGTDGGKSSFGA